MAAFERKTTILDRIACQLTTADFLESDSIREGFGNWQPLNHKRFADQLTTYYLSVYIYVRRMRRHNARIRAIVDAAFAERES